jgi:hypothetical protein
MKRAIIAGGGVSGLICAYVFSKHKDVETKVLEPRTIGGEFLAGGLKYIHRTDMMEWLFRKLGVMYSHYTINGGIMLRGDVLPYPKCFQEFNKIDAARIQADHYRKTRRMEPGTHGNQAMNDPASIKPRRALRCHFPEMINKLAEHADVIRSGVSKVEDEHVVLSSGDTMPYDYLVLTVPLWVIKRVVKFYVPDGNAMKLNVAVINPKKDRYARWDYVYTPYTPEDCIHRLSPEGAGYAVEVNGNLDKQALYSDLNFIFRDGWYIESLREGLKGHLLPLDSRPELPENVELLGRFARWDPRATTDVTLEDAADLAQRWFI